MKKMLWLLAIPLAVAAAVLLGGCGGAAAAPEDPVDGGVTDRSDPDAPKTIESMQLVSFDCRFSTMDMDEPGDLGNHIYVLWARFENGAVKAGWQVEDTGEEHSFRQSHDFLRRLREAAEQYDLLLLNGHDVFVSGLPEDYGATLKLRYASGETVYASDNQDNFLSFEAMNGLLRLFEQASTPPVLH